MCHHSKGCYPGCLPESFCHTIHFLMVGGSCDNINFVVSAPLCKFVGEEVGASVYMNLTEVSSERVVKEGAVVCSEDLKSFDDAMPEADVELRPMNTK